MKLNVDFDVAKWDGTEVHPIADLGNDVEEICEEGEESFWSVYVHLVAGGMISIADFHDKQLAFQFEEVIIKLMNNYVKDN